MKQNEFKTDEDFESAFAEAVECFSPPAGLQEQIEKRLADSRAAEPPPRKHGKYIRIAKWVMPPAAACIAAAILLIAFLPHPAVVPSAYAEIVQAVQNSKSAEWVHGVYANGQQEVWMSTRPYRIYSKDPSGNVFYEDDNRKKLFYEAEKNILRRQDSTAAMYDVKINTFNSALDFFLLGIQEEKDRGAVVTKSRQTILGKKCTVYHVQSTDGDKWKTLAVDSATNRVVRFSIREQGQESTVDIDYPSNIPEDIYALGVPHDAKIVDERTRDEQSNRMCIRACEAKRKFDKNLRAIVATGPYDPKTKNAAVTKITVYYQKPHQRRVEYWYVKIAELLRPDHVEEVDAFLQTHSPDSVWFTAPYSGSVSYNLTYTQEVRKSTIKYGLPARLESLIWLTYPDRFGRSLPDITTPNGKLLGTRRINPAVICQNVSGREVGYLPVRWTVYVNPEKDFIAEQWEEWIGSLTESWLPRSEKDKTFPPVSEHVRGPGKTKTTVLEYARTSAGRWYPKKQLIEGFLHGKPGIYLRVIHLDTRYTFPEKQFSAEAFEEQLDKPVKSY